MVTFDILVFADIVSAFLPPPNRVFIFPLVNSILAFMVFPPKLFPPYSLSTFKLDVYLFPFASCPTNA